MWPAVPTMATMFKLQHILVAPGAWNANISNVSLFVFWCVMSRVAGLSVLQFQMVFWIFYLSYQEHERAPLLLSIQSKTGKTVNCMTLLPLMLWSSLGILSASTRCALANKRERKENRYLPENGEISTQGLQSRLWSWAGDGSIHERDVPLHCPTMLHH